MDTGPIIHVASLANDNLGTSSSAHEINPPSKPKAKGQHGGARPGSGRKRKAVEDRAEFSTLKIHRSLCDRWCYLRKKLGLKSNSATAEYLLNLAEFHAKQPTVVSIDVKESEKKKAGASSNVNGMNSNAAPRSEQNFSQVCFFSYTGQTSTGATLNKEHNALPNGGVEQKRKRTWGDEDVVFKKITRVEIEPGPSHSVPLKTVQAIGDKDGVADDLSHSKSKLESLDKVSASCSLTHQWKEVDTILVLQSGPPIHSRKVACFNLDGTLTETASGSRFATGPSDWRFMSLVLPKLRSLHGDGYKIVIFTDQLGMAKGKPTKPEFSQKMESITAKLEIPTLVIASTANDVYRKPCMGMWEHLIVKENGGIEVNVEDSFYIGDAAGREAKWRPEAKKDFSCGDRKFAANLNLPFSTPEEFFLGLPKCTKFSWGGFIPSSLDYTKTTPTLQPPNSRIHSEKQEVIVFVGCPASGKSTFYEMHLAPRGYALVNRDILGSLKMCVDGCKHLLSAGKSVVVDNTSPDIESRKKFVQCCQTFGVPARCFRFMTSIAHSKHNNRFRELTMKKSRYVKVNDLAFNMYKSRFCEPQVSEGFSKIVKVHIQPNFAAKMKEELYKLFLVE